MISRIPTNTIETEAERESVASFMEAARLSGPFNLEPRTLKENSSLGVFLKTGEDVPALALFEDDLGNWTVLRKKDRMVRQYFGSEVA